MPCRIPRDARRIARSLILLVSVAGAAGPAAHAAACSDNNLRVAVDFGHNRSAPGVISATGKKEFDFNRRFANELVAGARSEPGLDMFLINPTGRDLGLGQRPQLAAARKAELFVSIHHDSVQAQFLKPWTHNGVRRQFTQDIAGFGLFVSDRPGRRAEDLKLAQLIGDRLRGIGLKPSLHHAEPIKGEGRTVLDRERGIYEAPFAVLVNARMPAILIEVAVLPNKEDERRAEDAEWRRRFQGAVIEGLKAFCKAS